MAGEINLQRTIEKLFTDGFGIGYPPEDAERKRQDTLLLKKINALTKRKAIDVFGQLDEVLIQKTLQKRNVVEYILEFILAGNEPSSRENKFRACADI